MNPSIPSSPGPRRALVCHQFAPEFGRVDENLDTIRRALDTVEADVVVLPELCTTGYTFTSRDELASLAEPVPDGPTTRALADIAAERRMTICAGVAERDGERLYNAAVLVGTDGLIGVYRKVHLFDRENDLFDRGDDGFHVFEVGAVRIGVMICFDWFYPESLRTLTVAGADIVLHPSNLVLPWCQRSMPVRCLENHVICATANRTGDEIRGGVEHRFTGASQITGCGGEILARAPETGDACIRAEVLPHRSRDRRMGAIPDLLAHRRPELYR